MAPVFSLLILAPLIAEYLLGNLTFGQLRYFPLLLLMYGGGAVFIRELARRYRRGWPTILMLGLAYGLVEEGLSTQSLFNPHYLGLHLIDFGYIPALGIGAPWTVYVLGIHTVWSISVPIAFVESLFPGRRNAPWLGRVGLGVVGLLFAVGAAALTLFSYKMGHFFASGTQIGVCAVLIVAVAAAAFLFSRAGGGSPPRLPVPARRWMLGLVAFVCGSCFPLIMSLGASPIPPVGVVAIQFVPVGIAWAVIRRSARTGGWNDASTDAVATGALLVYCWWGFRLSYSLHGTASLPGQCFPCAVILSLLAFRHFRPRRGNPPSGGLPETRVETP